MAESHIFIFPTVLVNAGEEELRGFLLFLSVQFLSAQTELPMDSVKSTLRLVGRGDLLQEFDGGTGERTLLSKALLALPALLPPQYSSTALSIKNSKLVVITRVIIYTCDAVTIAFSETQLLRSAYATERPSSELVNATAQLMNSRQLASQHFVMCICFF